MPTLTSRRGVGKYASLHAIYWSTPVTPSDTDDVPSPGGACTGFTVATAGDVVVTTLGGVVATFAAVPAGTIVDCGIRAVRATGTTATGVQALALPVNR